MTTVLDRPTPPAPEVAGRPSFRLRRRPHKVALLAHILTSVGWFGIAVVVAFCGIAAAVTSDPTLAHALYRTMETAPWLSIPVGVLAVATGVLLGLGTTFGLVRNWWVVAKIAIAAAVIATDALLVGSAAHDAAVSGDGAGPLYGPTVAHVVVLGVATVLSVFKPWGRTPWTRRTRAS
jgi:vacuolar-type H+-ATPase subunit I/STV1